MGHVAGVDRRAHVGAVALAHFKHAAEGQHPHRFAHGVAAHTDLGGEFGLDGDALPHPPLAAFEAFAHRAHGHVHQ